MAADTAPAGRAGDRLAIAAALARGRRQWRDPGARERSRLAVEAIGGPGRRRDTRARAHLAQSEAREEVIRRAWMVPGLPATGAHRLREASATGRGVLVSYCHFGPFAGMGVTVAEHSSDVHQVVGAWLLSTDGASPRRDAWRSIFESAGVPLIASAGCFPVVSELLRRGAVVAMTFDWPGSTETSFLGRPVQLTSGTARLAEASDALVVPAMRRFHRLLPRTGFGPALDPRRHAGWRGLHDALAAQHERWILQRPAALEDPRRPGAWEAGATAAQWRAARD